MAVEAEAAGFDAVMVSEHVVLGPGADAGGMPENPRDYALPGNQDPSTPWPDALTLLSAVASATSRLRLVASSIIAPLRHPLLLAKQLATLDLLSEGRLVVQPTVSWHRPEYEALGVPFERRGELLDEHLAAWRVLWRDSPASFEGRHYRFSDVWLEPKPFRPEGPALWFGGETMHERLLRRLVDVRERVQPARARRATRISSGCVRGWRPPAETPPSSRWSAAREGGSTARTASPISARRSRRSPRSSNAASPRSASSRRSSSTTRSEIGPFCREVVERVDALAR